MQEYQDTNFADEFLPYLLVLLVVSLLLYLFLYFLNINASQYKRASAEKPRIDFLGRPIADKASKRAEIVLEKQKLLLERRKDRLKNQQSLSDLRKSFRRNDI